MSLHRVRRDSEQLRKEEQLQFGGDFVTAKVPIPKETDDLYSRIARHIRFELQLPEFPKDVIMGAVLAGPVEADIVSGFINGDFEVVSHSRTSAELLDEELRALEEGRLELGGVGLRRETRSAQGKTTLEHYKLAHPELVRSVEALTPEQKTDLIIEYLRTRASARGVLPTYLRALAQKDPERYAKVMEWLKAASARRATNITTAKKTQRGPRP